ncbi:MAG: hypothetical protein ACXIUD_13380 [Mongoliitalea sp.]
MSRLFKSFVNIFLSIREMIHTRVWFIAFFEKATVLFSPREKSKKLRYQLILVVVMLSFLSVSNVNAQIFLYDDYFGSLSQNEQELFIQDVYHLSGAITYENSVKTIFDEIEVTKLLLNTSSDLLSLTSSDPLYASIKVVSVVLESGSNLAQIAELGQITNMPNLKYVIITVRDPSMVNTIDRRLKETFNSEYKILIQLGGEG